MDQHTLEPVVQHKDLISLADSFLRRRRKLRENNQKMKMKMLAENNQEESLVILIKVRSLLKEETNTCFHDSCSKQFQVYLFEFL